MIKYILFICIHFFPSGCRSIKNIKEIKETSSVSTISLKKDSYDKLRTRKELNIYSELLLYKNRFESNKKVIKIPERVTIKIPENAVNFSISTSSAKFSVDSQGVATLETTPDPIVYRETIIYDSLQSGIKNLTIINDSFKRIIRDSIHLFLADSVFVKDRVEVKVKSRFGVLKTIKNILIILGIIILALILIKIIKK